MGRLFLMTSLGLLVLVALVLLIKRRFSLMAERYQGAPARFPTTKGLMLFVLPLPVLFAAIGALGRGNLSNLFDNAVCYGLFLWGALLLQRGLRTEADYTRRQVAKAPWPLKTLGSGVIALATALTAWSSAQYLSLIHI